MNTLTFDDSSAPKDAVSAVKGRIVPLVSIVWLHTSGQQTFGFPFQNCVLPSFIPALQFSIPAILDSGNRVLNEPGFGSLGRFPHFALGYTPSTFTNTAISSRCF